MRRIVLKVLLVICGFFSGVVFMIYRCGYILKGEKKRADRFFAYFNLLDRWLVCKEHNNQFKDYFHKNCIKNVAIYRMGKLGNHLRYELNKAEVKFIRDVDKIDILRQEAAREDFIYDREVHYNIQDELPLVDAVIVTSIDEFETVKSKILKKNKMLNVISLETILDSIDGD